MSGSCYDASGDAQIASKVCVKFWHFFTVRTSSSLHFPSLSLARAQSSHGSDNIKHALATKASRELSDNARNKDTTHMAAVRYNPGPLCVLFSSVDRGAQTLTNDELIVNNEKANYEALPPTKHGMP